MGPWRFRWGYNRNCDGTPMGVLEKPRSPGPRLSTLGSHSPVLPILAIAALIVAFALGYWIGRARSSPTEPDSSPLPASAPSLPPESPAPIAPSKVTDGSATTSAVVDHAIAERARLIRSYEAEAAVLRHASAAHDAARAQLEAFAEERRRMFGQVADAQGEIARYRALVVSLEDNAPPPLLDGPGTPDDLKLIVGVGPVLERMLQQLGIATYRQIARWSERDIDDYDAKLAEFPGRIRRDGWVTQARSLHQSKYGVSLPTRDRG